jgi:DNA primase
MIDGQTKQRIIDAANILEVVQDFVSLRRSGVSYVGLCPFHSDRKPSFYVSPSKNVCKCFSCGEGGSPVHFIMKHEQLSYNEALRYLAKKYHIEIVEREETDEEKKAASERQSLFILNDYAQKFFVDQLHNTDDGRNIGLSYFRERGLRPDIIEKFGLGYAPELRDIFTKQALTAGYPIERLTAVGLSIQYEDKPPHDRFRGRVIFPVRNLSGQYVAFGGRIMGKADKTAKYINSPESLIYSKSRELYGLYQAKQAISKANKCYLVEGYTDVISMHQSGVENVVASSGTALTVQQIRLIRRFTERVTVLYDGDNAGIKAALRGIDLLLEEGLDIKVVLLPEGEDPDSYAQKHSRQELLDFLDAEETDFIHFKIRLYQSEMQRDPIRRAELIKDVLRTIALIPDTIRRTVLIQSSAALLNMDEALLKSEVAKFRAQGYHAHNHPQSVPTAPVVETQPEVINNAEEANTSEPSFNAQEYQPKFQEISLINLLIQKGNTDILALVEDEKGELIYTEYKLGAYIREELELDGLLDSVSPFCLDMLNETVDVCLAQNVLCSEYFSNHEHEAIRRLAADLLSKDMNHHISQPEEEDFRMNAFSQKLANALDESSKQEILAEQALYLAERKQKMMIAEGNKALWELDQIRMAVVLDNIHKIQEEMVQAEREGDFERVLRLLKELQAENAFKQELAQTLGERTIKA